MAVAAVFGMQSPGYPGNSFRSADTGGQFRDAQCNGMLQFWMIESAQNVAAATGAAGMLECLMVAGAVEYGRVLLRISILSVATASGQRQGTSLCYYSYCPCRVSRQERRVCQQDT